MAKLVTGKSGHTLVLAKTLKRGMIVLCEKGDIIPGDGDVIEGIALVDESMITGESAPVIREPGEDRAGVMAGTRVISDWIKVRVSSHAGEGYLDKMIQLIEAAKRTPSPNEKALGILLVSISVLFIFTLIGLKVFVMYYEGQFHSQSNSSLIVMIGLLVCLIPTTIGGLLSAVGISGMERLLAHNVIAKSGRAVEACGDIDILLLDKTGTITHGNRMAHKLFPAPMVDEEELAEATLLASMEDTTPEGKSIVFFIDKKFPNARTALQSEKMTFIPFTAETRMSGVDFLDAQGNVTKRIRKGAVNSVFKMLGENGTTDIDAIKRTTDMIGSEGGTPLLVSENNRILGAVYLKDTIKKGISERFARLRQMGIKTVMITGDNPRTAATIAAEAGVDDFISESNPEQKLQRIAFEQEKGRMVGMIGDGTNDAPALAQANVGMAMNSGTQAAKEAANMIDLDSDPTKLMDVVETGKELLITRGALTTFSVANDIAKYFTIIPAVFSGLLVIGNRDAFSVLNIIHLVSPKSAILSAVIFNALIIVLLIPLALKGVKTRMRHASALLRRNVLIYGIGGIIAPFIGIKLIDVIINLLHFI